MSNVIEKFWTRKGENNKESRDGWKEEAREIAKKFADRVWDDLRAESDKYADEYDLNTEDQDILEAEMVHAIKGSF